MAPKIEPKSEGSLRKIGLVFDLVVAWSQEGSKTVPRGPLGPSWGALGPLLGALGPCLEGLGGLLGRLEALLDSFGTILATH